MLLRRAFLAVLSLIPAVAMAQFRGVAGHGVIMGGHGFAHRGFGPGTLRFGGFGGLAPFTGFGHINHPGLGFAPNTPGIGFPLVVGPSRFRAFGPFGPGFHPHIVDPFSGTVIHFGGVHTSSFFGGLGGIIPVPIAVPMGIGYGPQQPSVIVIQIPPAQVEPARARAAPATQEGAQPPVSFQYETPRQPEQAAPSKSPVLLVLKDHSMYAVADYWVEGDRLHYVFSYGVQKSVPLDQLDLEFTKKLNEERNVKFDLKRK